MIITCGLKCDLALFTATPATYNGIRLIFPDQSLTLHLFKLIPTLGSTPHPSMN